MDRFTIESRCIDYEYLRLVDSSGPHELNFVFSSQLEPLVTLLLEIK